MYTYMLAHNIHLVMQKVVLFENTSGQFVMNFQKSLLSLSLFSFCVCFGNLAKNRDSVNTDFDLNNSSRNMKGLEDFGFGPCHTSGMKFTNRNIRYKFLSALKYENVSSKCCSDIIDIENKCIEANTSMVRISVYWSWLVIHDDCVDKLTITLGTEVQLMYTDPADATV